ncbi:hypothetical protein RA086_06985 [Lactiplantibacillus sp. WILCCON 0030]|uniref:Phage protein n=1 Tax=Lactiplantibacillus brownii TaxID=3069269 RepID=A0ABU1AAL0_9LACO|nr:hypothetical protein [Lactiplantibacillus brownii]MDQ7937370.1 hypothetical protein [Lactiplantibacillus brownii]
MKLTDIASNIAKSIQIYQANKHTDCIVYAVEFTDESHKAAQGCVVAQVDDATHYSLTSYDCRYMDTGKKLLAQPLGAFFECDDDLDQRTALIEAIKADLDPASTAQPNPDSTTD